MDHEAASARFAPDRRFTIGALTVTLVAAGAGVLTTDPAGRVVAACAAVLAAAYVVTDLLFSPRLVVEAWGIRVNTPATRASVPWDRSIAVRHDTRARHGIRGNILELDCDDVLVVFTRRSLGADPGEVAALIEAFRPPGPG